MKTDFIKDMMLEVSPDWRIVEPRGIEYLAVFEDINTLKISSTDFENPKILVERRATPDCPYEFDSESGTLYFAGFSERDSAEIDERLVNTSRFNRKAITELLKQESYIYSISLSSLEIAEIAKAPEGYAFNWLLKLSPDNRKLYSYLLSLKKMDYLFASIDIQSGMFTTNSFEANVFHPRDICFSPEIVLIDSGDMGLAAFDFDGRIVSSLSEVQVCFSASLHHDRKEVVFDTLASGKRKIGIWDMYSGSVEFMPFVGVYPVWSPDGSCIWFRENDASLCKMDIKSRKVEKIISFKDSENQNWNYSGKVIFSPNHRYVFSTLSRTESMEQEEKMSPKRAMHHNYTHLLCILDTELKLAWAVPGYSYNFAWVQKGAWW
ncbi:MAG: hypothetical protein RDV48_30930 [Candidatus Eremiobacteraeota bacterium]|nr:hypothetical protein [Candidatus Eremiobacteraeota bacterium]